MVIEGFQVLFEVFDRSVAFIFAERGPAEQGVNSSSVVLGKVKLGEVNPLIDLGSFPSAGSEQAGVESAGKELGDREALGDVASLGLEIRQGRSGAVLFDWVSVFVIPGNVLDLQFRPSEIGCGEDALNSPAVFESEEFLEGY